MVKPSGKVRISQIDTYLNVAETFAYRSTCLKRKYGAVIVKDDAVISTGYNGSPRGLENCCDIGECPRIRLELHRGQGYEMCGGASHSDEGSRHCRIKTGSGTVDSHDGRSGDGAAKPVFMMVIFSGDEGI